MIVVVLRTQQDEAALFHVDEPTWEQARELIQAEVKDARAILALVPKEF